VQSQLSQNEQTQAQPAKIPAAMNFNMAKLLTGIYVIDLKWSEDFTLIVRDKKTTWPRWPANGERMSARDDGQQDRRRAIRS